jgi:hypothetical protein
MPGLDPGAASAVDAQLNIEVILSGGWLTTGLIEVNGVSRAG